MNPVNGSAVAGRRRICSSCKADIFWRLHARTGNAAPLDAQPTADGNVVLDDDDTYRVLTKAERAAIADDETLDTRPRYTSHFATCSSAASHRRF